MQTKKTHTQMITNSAAYTMPWVLNDIRPGGSQNYSIITDPECEKLFQDVQANYFDRAAVGKLYTEPTATRPNFITYANEQAWFITPPSPYYYSIWQPWVKGYGGARYITYHCFYDYAKYTWIDQALKKLMGY